MLVTRQILDIRVQTQLDNTSVAIVSVPHIDDARFTISQFHRKKIGYKRIHVSLLNPDGGDTNPPNVRWAASDSDGILFRSTLQFIHTIIRNKQVLLYDIIRGHSNVT